MHELLDEPKAVKKNVTFAEFYIWKSEDNTLLDENVGV